MKSHLYDSIKKLFYKSENLNSNSSSANKQCLLALSSSHFCHSKVGTMYHRTDLVSDYTKKSTDLRIPDILILFPALSQRD